MNSTFIANLRLEVPKKDEVDVKKVKKSKVKKRRLWMRMRMRMVHYVSDESCYLDC